MSNLSRFLAMAFGITAALGECAQISLFIYCDWLYVRESFVNFINPFILLAAAWDLLHMSVFWLCLGVTIVCGGLFWGFTYLADALQVEKGEAEE